MHIIKINFLTNTPDGYMINIPTQGMEVKLWKKKKIMLQQVVMNRIIIVAVQGNIRKEMMKRFVFL